MDRSIEDCAWAGCEGGYDTGYIAGQGERRAAGIRFGLLVEDREVNSSGPRK